MSHPRYLLTGASSGIGQALASELAAAGFSLVLAARRKDSLEQLAATLRDHYPAQQFVPYTLDVCDYHACAQAISDAQTALGGLDGVIANAGIALSGRAGRGHFDKVQRTIETNLLGAIACLDAATAVFRAQNHGHLVAIASVAGKLDLPATCAYSASKAGLISYMRSLDAELSRTAIRTTTLLPGFIDTPLNRDAASRPFLIDVEHGAKLIARHILAKRRSAYVPSWPWALIGRLGPWLPTSLLAKLG